MMVSVQIIRCGGYTPKVFFWSKNSAQKRENICVVQSISCGCGTFAYRIFDFSTNAWGLLKQLLGKNWQILKKNNRRVKQMRGLETQNTFVTFVGRGSQADGLALCEVEIISGRQHINISFAEGGAHLCPKVVKVAQDILTNAHRFPQGQHPFLCRVGALQFEDFCTATDLQGNVSVQLRVTKGKIVDFFEGELAENTLPELEDVFLPLTNLAAYLRAVGDTPNGSSGPEALHLTADRIEEFLLIYGGRLLDKAHSEPSPQNVLV